MVPAVAVPQTHDPSQYFQLAASTFLTQPTALPSTTFSRHNREISRHHWIVSLAREQLPTVDVGLNLVAGPHVSVEFGDYFL